MARRRRLAAILGGVAQGVGQAGISELLRRRELQERRQERSEAAGLSAMGRRPLIAAQVAHYLSLFSRLQYQLML